MRIQAAPFPRGSPSVISTRVAADLFEFRVVTAVGPFIAAAAAAVTRTDCIRFSDAVRTSHVVVDLSRCAVALGG